MQIQKDMNRYKFQMGGELPPEIMQQMQGMPTEQGIPMEQGVPVEQGNGEASFAQQLMVIEQQIDKIQKEMKKLEKRDDKLAKNEYRRLEQQLAQLEQQKEMLRAQVEQTRQQLEQQEQMQGDEYIDPNAQYEMSPEELAQLDAQYQDVPMEEQINPEEMQMMQYGGKMQTGNKILNWLGQIPASETIGGQISENTMKNLDKDVSEGKISYDEYKNRLNMAIAETLKGNATGAFLSGTAFAGPIVEQISPVISFADKATTGFLGSSGLWSQIPALLLDNWSNNSYRNIYGKDNPASYTVTKREIEERKKQADSQKKSFGGKMQLAGGFKEDLTDPKKNNINIDYSADNFLNYDYLEKWFPDKSKQWLKNNIYSTDSSYKNSPKNIPLDETLARAALNAQSQENYEEKLSWAGLDRFKNDKEGLIKYAMTGEPGNAYDFLNKLIIRNQNTSKPYPYHTDEEREQLLAEEPKLSLDGLYFTPKRVRFDYREQRPSGIDNADQRLHDAIVQQNKANRRDLRNARIQNVRDYFGNRPLTDYLGVGLRLAAALDNRDSLANAQSANELESYNPYIRQIDMDNQFYDNQKRDIDRHFGSLKNELKRNINNMVQASQPRSVFGRSANMMAVQDKYNEGLAKIEDSHNQRLSSYDAERSKTLNQDYSNFGETELDNRKHNRNIRINANKEQQRSMQQQYGNLNSAINAAAAISQDRRDRAYIEGPYRDMMYDYYYMNLVSNGMKPTDAQKVIDNIKKKKTNKGK